MQSFIKQHLSDSAAWNDLYDDGLVKVPKTGGSLNRAN